MFSWTVFKNAWKSNFLLWLVVTFATTAFLCATMVAVDRLIASNSSIPGGGNVFSLLDQTFFSMMGILLPLIYAVVVSNRLIAKDVDNGSMAFTLTTPVGRTRLILSRMAFLILSLAGMFGMMTLGGWLAASSLGIDLNADILVKLMLNLLFLELAFSAIALTTSALFNKSSMALGLGAGITLGMFLLSTIGGLAADLEVFQQASLIRFYDVKGIIDGAGSHSTDMLILSVIALSLMTFAFHVFRTKDLPL